MKLGITAKSERGKAITKTGNEFIQINIHSKPDIIDGSIYITPDLVYGSIYGQKFEIKNTNGSLKHGN